jgi:hypothetical protein
MAGIFIGAGLTERNFAARTVFLTAQIFQPETMPSGPEMAETNEPLSKNLQTDHAVPWTCMVAVAKRANMHNTTQGNR